MIDGLIEEGMDVALIGKTIDEKQGYVNVECPSGCYDFRDLTSLGGMIALISKAKITLTNDSVPVHIAGAFDNWLVVIPTCKHPDHILPFRRGSQYYKTKALYKQLSLDDLDTIWLSEKPDTIDTLERDILEYIPDSKEVVEQIMDINSSISQESILVEDAVADSVLNNTVDLCVDRLDMSVIHNLQSDYYLNILDDLSAFTGLTRNNVVSRLRRFPKYHFQSEFNLHDPQSHEEIIWFYVCNSSYLFANATHPYWDRLDFITNDMGPVLDYGAGVGNNALFLAKKGISVDYMDVSIIQQEFVKFRAKRHGLTNINFISSYKDNVFDPVGCIRQDYGVVILVDVLEHIPNYDITLKYIIDHVISKGYIIDNSNFSMYENDSGVHIKPSISLEQAMISMEEYDTNIWRKI